MDGMRCWCWSVSRGIWVATLLIVTGCGSGDPYLDARPQVYAVSGSVTFNGEPVEGAFVTFSPIGGSHGASGITNREGQFSLTTFEQNDGAAAGNYNVSIKKVETDETPNPADPVNLPPLRVEQRHLLPEIYSSKETSGLTAEVSASEEPQANQFKFDLIESAE